MGHTLFIPPHLQVSVWQRNEAGAPMGGTAGATGESERWGLKEVVAGEGVVTGPGQSGGGWATCVWGQGIKQCALRQKCRKRALGALLCSVSLMPSEEAWAGDPQEAQGSGVE